MKFDYVLPETVTEKGKKGEPDVTEPHPFSGKVTLQIPNAAERAKLVSTVKYGPDKDGNVIELSSLDSGIKVVEIAHKYVEAVDVTHKKTGKHFTSIEELECYKAGGQLLQDMSEFILGGMPLGEN